MFGKGNIIVVSGRGKGKDVHGFTKKGQKAKVWCWRCLAGMDRRPTDARDKRCTIFVGDDLFKEVDHGETIGKAVMHPKHNSRLPL
jgi:hypothetical protein